MDKAFTSHLPSLKYVLLPGTLPFSEASKEAKQLHERAYLYWKQFWTQVFIDNGDRRKISSDDFMRQNLISLILHDDVIIAMHLYSFFDVTLESVKDHTYFSRTYDKHYMDFLNAKAKTAMSWEYLTVDSGWRKKNVGFSFATVLVGLAAKIQKALNIDAGIAVSRSDVKVTQIGELYGAKVIVPQVNMHNTPCDLIACLKEDIKSSEAPLIESYVSELWKNRRDLTGKNYFSDLSSVIHQDLRSAA